MTWFLLRNRENLEKAPFKARYGNMYAEVHVTRSKYSVLYQPIFLVRRILFVAIPCTLLALPSV
jgi:hypothetical protein